MSDIVERTLAELLQKSVDDADFKENKNLEKLKKATQTLYTISLTKIPKLRPEENVARCHIAGLIALEKLEAKHPESNLQYHVSQVPLDPRNVLKLKNMFKDILLNSSPVKKQFETNGIKWLSPSKNQALYSGDQSSSPNIMKMSPQKLSKHLFPSSSPTKTTSNLPSSPLSKSAKSKFGFLDSDKISEASTPSPIKPRLRRKLAFELEEVTSSPSKGNNKPDEPETNDGSPRRRLRNRSQVNYTNTALDDIYGKTGKVEEPRKRRRLSKKSSEKDAKSEEQSQAKTNEGDDGYSPSSEGGNSEAAALNQIEKATTQKAKGRPAKVKSKSQSKKEQSTLSKEQTFDNTGGSASRVGNTEKIRSGLFYSRYKRLEPERIIDLCNKFELPSDVAIQLMDFYYENSQTLTSSYRLICGLILNCCKYVFIKQRTENPSLDYILINRMKNIMECTEDEEIYVSMELAYELLEGSPWYRNLRNKYVNTSREDFLNGLLERRGSVLQINKSFGTSSTLGTTVSDDFFESWREKTIIDLHFKHGT
ncbi:hypothetical protein ACO0QE_001082 [Hanseniaspora vineae]